MIIRYLDCDGKNKLFSWYGHDYKTWTDPETNKFYMIDGGQGGYNRFSGGLPKEDTLENLIKEIREDYKWGKNFDKDGNKLEKTEWVLLKDLETDHIYRIIEYLVERLDKLSDSTAFYIMLQELVYRVKNKGQ